MTHAGLARAAAAAIGVVMALYHMWIIATGSPEAMIFRGTHLIFAMVLTFLVFNSRRDEEGKGPALIDYIFAAASAVAILYLFVNYKYVINRIYYIDDLEPSDMVMAVVLMVLIIEATRRLIGWALPITAMVFLGHALFIAQVEPMRLLDQMYMTTEGIFGTTLGVSATYVIIFVLFGSFMERTGTDRKSTRLNSSHVSESRMPSSA